MAMKMRIWRNYQFSTWQPNLWDVLALLLLFTVFVLLAWAAKQMAVPYHLGEMLPISLSTHMLPQYALRTVLRMLIALCFALFFTLTVGTLAAKNKHAERIIIPMIDILQSVPVLGFLSITVVGFIKVFPNSMLGPECAAIFAIFTAQAWNMCLGFYQSLRMIPYDLREAASMFQLSPWQRFWRVEVPFAIPSLMWNTMISMSASWFFVVASEAISVNHQNIALPGIGSYIAVAIAHSNKAAMLHAIITMLIVILFYDQLLFRPLLKWSEKFRFESTAQEKSAASLWIRLLQKTRFLSYLGKSIDLFLEQIINFRGFSKTKSVVAIPSTHKKSRTTSLGTYVWYTCISIILLFVLYVLLRFIFKEVSIHEVPHVLFLGLLTSIKIILLTIICSFIWVPIGVWIGLHPRVTQWAQPIAQFLAAFPANFLFPIVVLVILKYQLNVQVWTAPLMILGTQWYILFNVIAGATALPKDLVQVAQNLGLKRWLWWKRFILPGIFPYFITGAITAAGGAWNASIVAEVVSWGSHTLTATGLGAYIKQVTTVGDFPHIALGISVMCLYVLIFNRLVWQPLYNMAEKRFQLD